MTRLLHAQEMNMQNATAFLLGLLVLISHCSWTLLVTLLVLFVGRWFVGPAYSEPSVLAHGFFKEQGHSACASRSIQRSQNTWRCACQNSHTCSGTHPMVKCLASASFSKISPSKRLVSQQKSGCHHPQPPASVCLRVCVFACLRLFVEPLNCVLLHS